VVQIILAQNPGLILEKFEKETVRISVNSGMDFLLQNEIKIAGIENWKSMESFFFAGTIISLVIFLLITILLLLYIQKLSLFIMDFSDLNNKISEGISSIQTAETDEIKELAMTRNALFMKLDEMKNKS